MGRGSVGPVARRRAAGARPGRRWILAAGGRGCHGLAGDLWPPAGDIAGAPGAVFGRRQAGSAPPSTAPTAGSRAGRFSTITDASVCLLARQRRSRRRPAPFGTNASLELLRRGQSDDGGWGPRASSPPEPFDTALALLALAKCDQSPDIRGMIARGRAFLIAQQQEDGSWIETTRPPGNVSYAQRISTTGWATLALLATREPSARERGRSETVARPSWS